VEAAEHAHHFVSATTTELSGKFDACLDGLGSRVAKEHLTAASEELVDGTCSTRGDGICKKVADMKEGVCLFGDRIGDSRMRMPVARRRLE